MRIIWAYPKLLLTALFASGRSLRVEKAIGIQGKKWFFGLFIYGDWK